MAQNDENKKRRDRRCRDIASLLTLIAFVSFIITCVVFFTDSPRLTIFFFIVTAISFTGVFVIGKDDPDDPIIFDSEVGDCPPDDQ